MSMQANSQHALGENGDVAAEHLMPMKMFTAHDAHEESVFFMACCCQKNASKISAINVCTTRQRTTTHARCRSGFSCRKGDMGSQHALGKNGDVACRAFDAHDIP